MFDYHVHSLFSADSKMKMEEACLWAIELGIKEMAFTDHIDYFYPNCDLTFEFDYNKYRVAIDKVRDQFKQQLTILKGVEIGLHPSVYDQNLAFTTSNELDFIIGSVHLSDDLDLHNGDFFQGKDTNQAIETYFLSIYQNVKQFKQFNVLGHLTLIKRYLNYVNTHWTKINWKQYFDIVEEIYKELIETSRGIEVNMSGFRYRIDCALPDLSFIQLYRELGGEIITVGTDAHSKHFVGKHLDLGYELLSRAGFNYVTTFRNRKPTFVSLKDL